MKSEAEPELTKSEIEQLRAQARSNRMRWKNEAARGAFERSGNPYYAWYAIHRCTKGNRPLPEWVIAYLAQCSERMLSPKAKRSTDLRKVLPRVLGFPSKRGPGDLLKPDGDPKRYHFALEFGHRVLAGQDPVTARRDACNDVFHGKDADADDKTLVRWICNAFGLKKAPKNKKQWEDVALIYTDFGRGAPAEQWEEIDLRQWTHFWLGSDIGQSLLEAARHLRADRPELFLRTKSRETLP